MERVEDEKVIAEEKDVKVVPLNRLDGECPLSEDTSAKCIPKTTALRQEPVYTFSSRPCQVTSNGSKWPCI